MVLPAGQDDGMASMIPGPARDFARAVTRAVDTAISGGDVATYDRVIAQLATQPAGGRVLGDVLRSLLEDTHPDGFDSADISRWWSAAAIARPWPGCHPSGSM